ncbi:hypothetical protein [Candidatus Leptofilum sp.]|uniref:hypothetical protein n=1 Tax=Candidatus Leptofilum sp. TaxID=3241576 RepID=UPI003B59984B
MMRFGNQEVAAGLLFFVALGWLVVDIVLSVPQQAPALWPLIPMFIAVVWYVALEHFRSQNQAEK